MWNSAQCYVAAWMGGGVWGRMDTCTCMAEFLHCSIEAITTLLIGIPQNKMFLVLKILKLKKKKSLQTTVLEATEAQVLRTQTGVPGPWLYTALPLNRYVTLGNSVVLSIFKRIKCVG